MKRTTLYCSILLLFILLIALCPNFYHTSDMEYWRLWAVHMKMNGMVAVYDTGSNYHPFFLYILWAYASLLEGVEGVNANIQYIKFPVLVFDFLPAIYLAAIAKRKHAFKVFLLLLNLAYFYNTVIWGQVDSIYTAFIFFSLIFIVKRPYLGVIFFILALSTKMQAIIFIPPLLIALFSNRLDLRKGVSLVLLSIFTMAIILAPIIIGGALDQLSGVVFGAVDFYQAVSMNAYNMWYYFIETPMLTADFNEWNGLQYKNWGMILFFLLSFLALLPLFLKTWRLRKDKLEGQVLLSTLFLTSALIVLLFFFFNTQMHERYSHPAILLLFGYGFYTGRYGLYILTSMAYLLNMEGVLKFFDIAHHTLIFEPQFVASLFFLAIGWAFVELYRDKKLPSTAGHMFSSLLRQRQTNT